MANSKSKRGPAIKLTGSWDELNKLLSKPKHTKLLMKHTERSTKKVGAIAQKEMKTVIATGAFRKNANLTIALKHSNRPLMHTGRMRMAVTNKMIRKNSVFVGILRSNPVFDRAVTVHGTTKTGAIIKVTPKMRRMFDMLTEASRDVEVAKRLTGRAAELFAANPGDWRPISARTNYIRIRPRPFVDRTVGRKGLQRRVAQEWSRGIQSAYNEMTNQVNRRR